MKIIVVKTVTPELQYLLMEDESLIMINAEQVKEAHIKLTDDCTYIVLSHEEMECFQYVVGDDIYIIIGDTFETTEINGMLAPI
jgi:hypothetical protein